MSDLIERLRDALKPFAKAALHLHPLHPDDGLTLDGIEVAHWRRAWAVWSEANAEHDSSTIIGYCETCPATIKDGEEFMQDDCGVTFCKPCANKLEIKE